jgi:hypothetical protein
LFCAISARETPTRAAGGLAGRQQRLAEGLVRVRAGRARGHGLLGRGHGARVLQAHLRPGQRGQGGRRRLRLDRLLGVGGRVLAGAAQQVEPRERGKGRRLHLGRGRAGLLDGLGSALGRFLDLAHPDLQPRRGREGLRAGLGHELLDGLDRFLGLPLGDLVLGLGDGVVHPLVGVEGEGQQAADGRQQHEACRSHEVLTSSLREYQGL